jgi:methylglutaconyl-CoA hydratase
VITIKVTAPTATIILDRKSAHNALDESMVGDLQEAFDDLRQEKKVRAVVLTASGDTFCSGIDLKTWYSTMSDAQAGLESWQEMTMELQTLLEMMLRFPKVIVSSIDGGAIGFGLALLLASDLVVGSEKAYLTLPATRLGLVSGHVAPLLAFRYGASAAARLLLGHERIDGKTAFELGWIHRLVPSDQTWVVADQWARDAAASAPEAIQMSKRLLNEMIGESVFAALASGSSTLATMCSTECANEGLRAFIEKRSPTW